MFSRWFVHLLSWSDLAWFRAVSRKYPDKSAADILADLVKTTPGEEGKWFAADLRFDRQLAAARGIALAELESETRRLLESCPGVARVWTRSELVSGAAAQQPLGEFFINSFHPERSPDLMVQLEEHFLAWTSTATLSPMTIGSIWATMRRFI